MRYLCIGYPISSPKFILALGSPPSNLPCRAPCISQDTRIQQHKKTLPPLPTTTLAIIINWVQRTGQIFGHGKKVLQIAWWGGGGFGMTPWCDDLVCSWRRLLADRHSLPFPWTLSLHRRWCPSASHHPLTFLFLLALTFPLPSPFPSLGLSLCRPPCPSAWGGGRYGWEMVKKNAPCANTPP